MQSLCYRKGVYELIPFQKQNVNFTLEADVHRVGANIKVLFQLTDPNGNIDVAAPVNMSGVSVPRKDKLWQATCFEMFLRYPNEPSYYEFNFSLEPAWNSYAFKQYRQPQPPKINDTNYLQSMCWNGLEFQAEIAGFSTQFTYDIGLTAVLKEKSGELHYMALVHQGEKPDFHLSHSFILKR